MQWIQRALAHTIRDIRLECNLFNNIYYCRWSKSTPSELNWKVLNMFLKWFVNAFARIDNLHNMVWFLEFLHHSADVLHLLLPFGSPWYTHEILKRQNHCRRICQPKTHERGVKIIHIISIEKLPGLPIFLCSANFAPTSSVTVYSLWKSFSLFHLNYDYRPAIRYMPNYQTQLNANRRPYSNTDLNSECNIV